uniref:Uncharacterized protein n=1 Tax=Cacopsylla melanoneura TaxID=428564 RepID=A0A8D9BTR4_9HEMI
MFLTFSDTNIHLFHTPFLFVRYSLSLYSTLSIVPSFLCPSYCISRYNLCVPSVGFFVPVFFLFHHNIMSFINVTEHSCFFLFSYYPLVCLFDVKNHLFNGYIGVPFTSFH